MRAGLMVLFDVVSMSLIVGLWGAAAWVTWSVAGALSALGPLAWVIAPLVGLLALVGVVGMVHRLLPPIRPGRYRLMQDPQFFAWVARFVLQRALLAPGVGTLVFQISTLRFLALRALGAKVSFSTSMSSDVVLLDPWLLEAGPDATIGTGSLIAGHFVDRGHLVLGKVRIGAGSLIAARVVLAPGVSIGRDARVLTHAMLSEDVTIGDGATVGSDARIDRGAEVRPGVTLGTGCFVHRGATVTEDQPIRAEVRSP